MSNEAITAVRKSAIAPSGRKFVLFALADYADESWSCFPSIEMIAEFTGQGEKTIRDHLDALEADGILARERMRYDDGRLGRYRYFIQRRNLPVAKIARGEKHQEPPAKISKTTGENRRTITPIRTPIVTPRESAREKSRGSRLSEDWHLPREWGEWAMVEEGMDELQIRREADRFRDYWLGKSGAAARKADWQATWRNWIRRAMETAPKQRKGNDDEEALRLFKHRRAAKRAGEIV